MATHTDTYKNSQPLPTNHGPGRFARLLQRTRSKKNRKQEANGAASGVDTSFAVQVPEPSYQASATTVARAPPPRDTAGGQPTRAAAVPAMRSPAVNLEQPPPMLKKRASIRDRFRSLAKDVPNPVPEPEKQRAAYVPTHAAADFSRLALSPKPASRQRQRHSYDDVLATSRAPGQPTPIAVRTSYDEPRSPEGPRHFSQRGLDTLDENEPTQPQGRVGQHVRGTDASRPGLSLEESRPQRQGQGAIGDIGALPANLGASLSARVSDAPPEHDRGMGVGSEKDDQQPSDYELFLAREEERERAYRGHVIRAFAQHPYPRPEPEAAAYQPRNSATYTAADSAVVAEAAGPARKGREGRVSGLDSGIGSKSSSSHQSKQPQSGEEPPPPPLARVSSTRSRGHRKPASRTPSFGGAGRGAERGFERGPADVVAVPEEEAAYQGGAYTTSPWCAEGGYAAAQQPRTLRRQTSIKQKLGDYFKPARPLNPYEMPELARVRSARRI